MTKQKLKAPFPYFGGKRRVADMVWRRLGHVDNYIEPFCGSAAILLLRPTPAKIETINDRDCYVANFWRATSPRGNLEAVVDYCDGPVNETDLHSRHGWLVLSDDAVEFRERMKTDPDYFDPKIAGWWCWGMCCWIGGGFCSVPQGRSGERIWTNTKNVPWQGKGVTSGEKQIPKMTNDVSLISGPFNKRLAASRPQLGDAYDIGSGVHSRGDLGTCEQRREWLLDWFGRLRDRLRTVRVCCGDWNRVCSSHSVTTRLGLTGTFLDPPYPIYKPDVTVTLTVTLTMTVTVTNPNQPPIILDSFLLLRQRMFPKRCIHNCAAWEYYIFHKWLHFIKCSGF